MNHQEAVVNQTAERYLLGELPGSERDAFEEHFFVCPECADAVATGAMLADNTRAVFREQARPGPAGAALWRRLRAWLKAPVLWPAFAAVVLLLFAGYLEIVTIPSLRKSLASATAPQPIAAFALHAASRGAAQVINVPKGARFYTVYIDLPPSTASEFKCEIRDAAGAIRASVIVPRSQISDTLNLLLDTARTPPGAYTLVVRSWPEGPIEIGRYHFTVQLK
ncbi:MAG TPA: zf-HC2 domain-containing protein [Terriglobia bacterium]|nr:zf-HC2 domain-containing protein [Terriglobia bacterium]